jgi:calcineurin-like phosphoesterase family protein
LGLKNTELLFPVCNTLAVLGTFEEDEMEIDVNPEFIAKFNGTIISRSKNQVYARDDDFLYMLGDSPEPQNGKTLIQYIRKLYN